MRRYYLQQAVRAARLSFLEEVLLVAGLCFVVAGSFAALAGAGVGGVARVLGLAGLAAMGACAISRGSRLYRAGSAASMPVSVARSRVRTRPASGFCALTVALALGVPLAAAISLVVVVSWGWLVLAAVMTLACLAVLVTWIHETRRGDAPYARSSAFAADLLQRLCMRADMEAPGLVVEPGPIANAWTAGGRVHMTRPLLELLDDAEVEAVLAHEVAHLAHRDAAVMELCSVPSRVLLTFAEVLATRSTRWVEKFTRYGLPGAEVPTMLIVFVAVVCAPPAFVFGWLSRLSLLGMSRAREFAADAAAATLTGRPSALASALMKLDRQRDWAPRSDLRQVAAYAVLCIVGSGRPRLSRLFATHPPTSARVRRLEELERRIQARSHPSRLWEPVGG
jgi:heat shock protein HtpX